MKTSLFRFCLRLCALVTGLFLLPVLLIRAQPYDDSALRALLRPPEDCAAPCLMAIRPGVTGRDEAIELLRRHIWVEKVTNHTPIAYQMAGVPVDLPPGWVWSSQRPTGIDAAVEGILGIRGDRVDYFELTTRFRVGDLRLLLGRPDLEQRWSWVMSQGAFFKVSAWYAAARIEMIFEGRCPHTRRYDYPVIIRLRRSAPDLRPDAVEQVCQQL